MDDLELALALSKSQEDEDIRKREAKLQAKREYHDHIERSRSQQQLDADYALALQLEENELPQQKPRAPAAPSKRDEDNGSSLLGSLLGAITGLGTSPSSSSSVPVPAGSCYRCRRAPAGTRIHAMERTYCAGCFACAGCNQPFTGSKFFPHEAPGGASIEPYCQLCVRELFALRCCLCNDPLEGRYLKHTFFEEEKYCVFHEDNRKVCFSCARLEPLSAKTGKEGFVALPDGRSSCPSCIMTAVLDSSEALPLYLEAVEFLERGLGLRVPPEMRQVPVLAVDVPSLNEQKQQASANKRTPTVRGLTMYTTTTTVSISHVQPGGYQWDAYTGQLIVRPGAQQRYTAQRNPTREVTAVLVLYGLPRDLTASILAHEAFHVYLKLSREGFPTDLSPQAEEGLCQFVAERYLAHRERQLTLVPATSAAGEREARARDERLRQYFQQSIFADRSEIYGHGFRLANRCIANLGLDVVLEHVRTNKKLPDV